MKNMSNVYEVIKSRRTIRRFKNKPIPPVLLTKLIDMARLAPSGANIQPCEYVIVDDSDLVKKIFPFLKWAGYIYPSGNPPEGERPIAYIIVLIDMHKRKKGGEVDAAAAIENILLGAWDEGIGSCWIGSVDRKKITKLLRIPHYLKLDSVIALGYSNEKPVIEDATDSIKYWKDKNGTLHVPKRKLDELYHRNIYGKYLKEEI